MSIKKSIIQDVLVDMREIEKFAFESAKKAIEESIAPQIEQAVINSIKELEENSNLEDVISEDTISEDTINSSLTTEGIKLDIAPDADLTINVSAEGASIEVGSDNISTPDSIDNSNQEPEMNINPQEIQEDEIFEVEGLSEEDVAAMPAAPDAMAAPGAEANAVAEPEANLSTINDKLEDLTSKIDSLLSAVNPAGQGADGEVQVVDDDNAAAAPAPAMGAAPAAPAAPMDNTVVNEDDIMFEIEDDVMEGLFETDVVTEDSIDLAELESIEELEIVDEDEEVEGEENVEEMRGMGNAVQRSAGNRKNFEKNNNKHNAVSHVNESTEKIKAQYESKLDELIKENRSLKDTVGKYKNENKEYKDAFVELRQQVNEMQVFNGKLAYANMILTAGGITADEKVKIAEAFDKAETIEEAKKLYNKLMAEKNLTESTITSSDKLKASARPQVIQPKENSQTETIYESAESKRRKVLAGITKRENY